jgi:hypothetical protein
MQLLVGLCGQGVFWTHSGLPHSHTSTSLSANVANVSLRSSIRSIASRKTASFTPMRRCCSSIGDRISALISSLYANRPVSAVAIAGKAVAERPVAPTSALP